MLKAEIFFIYCICLNCLSFAITFLEFKIPAEFQHNTPANSKPIKTNMKQGQAPCPCVRPRPVIRPGFLSYQAENGPPRKLESLFYLVGRKFRMTALEELDT